MTTAVVVLNPAAQAALAAAEQRIERALKSFVDMGQALTEIRDGRLYKATHGTFEAYCQERWEIGRDYADRMIAAAQVVLTIVSKGLPAPTKESQARALVAVPEPERVDVWRETVERTDGKPTAAAIREVHEERTRPTPKTPGPVDSTTLPVGSGTTPAPAALPPDPQEPVATSSMPPLKPARKPTAEQAAQLPGAILTVLAGVDHDLGLTVDQIWARLPMASVHSSWVLPALHELADAGRVLVAGEGLHGTKWVATPEPDGVPSTAPSGSGPAEVAPTTEGGAASAPEPKPTLRLVPDAAEVLAAERRDARALLSRAVDLLAPVNRKPDWADVWVKQLGPYDDELSELVARATDAIAVLDDLIERCGR